MEKEIFIIGTEARWEEKAIMEAVISQGIVAQIISPYEIKIMLKSKGTQVFWNEKNITEQFKKNRIIFRRTRGAQTKMIALATLAENFKVHFTDSVESIFNNLNKAMCMPAIQTKHVHQIPTIFIGRRERLIENKLTPPYLVKPALGRHGEGVQVFKSKTALTKYLAKNNTEILVQNYLKIISEYRIFVIGKRAIGSIRKIPKRGSIAANYAAGSRFETAKLPRKIIKEAIKICQQQKIDIGGVDFAKTANGFYLLEINRCPEFKAFSKTTNLNVASAIVKFILTK